MYEYELWLYASEYRPVQLQLEYEGMNMSCGCMRGEYSRLFTLHEVTLEGSNEGTQVGSASVSFSKHGH